MISIHYKKQNSIKFESVVKLSQEFSDFNFIKEEYIINLSVKEIFEKWYYFNRLFWTILEWDNMYISFYGNNIYSKSDKEDVFYALQNAHFNWIENIKENISIIFDIYKDDIDINKLDTKNIDERTADLIIDLYHINKNK